MTVAVPPCTTSQVTCRKISGSIQELSQTAERALFVSGGALELTKCLWYLIHWLWDHRERAYLASSDDAPASLMMTQGDNFNEQTKIARLEPSDSHRTLSCFINILGDCVKQHEVLAQKATEYEASVRHPRIGKVDAYIQYLVFLHPGITFTLSVSSIYNSKLSTLQQRLLVPVKHKMKFRRTLPNAILFGPRGLGGLKFPHCPTYQGMEISRWYLVIFGSRK